MKINVLCQVTKLESLKRYPRKATGETDYSKEQESYTQSNLRVLDNAKGVTGNIQVESQLEFGQLVRLMVDTEGPEVVARIDQAVADCMAVVDRVVP
jgi:hypothetical protein